MSEQQEAYINVAEWDEEIVIKFEELIEKRNYQDYVAYLKLQEIKDRLTKKQQKEVNEIISHREELNAQLLEMFTRNSVPEGEKAH